MNWKIPSAFLPPQALEDEFEEVAQKNRSRKIGTASGKLDVEKDLFQNPRKNQTLPD